MSTLPEAIDYAFRLLYYGGQEDQERTAFSQRWGDLSLEAFTKALTAGSSEEKTLAIFALGKAEAPQVDTLLDAHLISQDLMERWPAALVLGERQDHRALPVLIALLDEALPPHISPLERDGGLYNYWRLHTVHILGEWKHDDVIPVLRRALLNAWKLEEAEQPEIKDIWYPYQDTLTYALGSLEVFGVLTNIILPIAHLHRWTVTLVCGSLQARQRHGDLLSQIQTNDALKSDIAQVLHRRFGLSETEQKAFIDGYADAYFAPH